MGDIINRVQPGVGYNFSASKVIFGSGKSPLNPNGTPTINTTYSRGSYPKTNTLTGQKLPNFRDLIRAGVDATTPFSATKYKYTSKPFQSLQSWNNVKAFDAFENSGSETIGGTYPYSFPFGDSTASAAFIASVRNRCIQKFRREYNSLANRSLTGETIGEYRAVIDGIRRPAAALRDYVKSYFGTVRNRTRGIHNRASIANVAAHTYLEWTFGWKPLAMSVQDAANAVFAFKARRPIERIYASASDIYVGSVSRDPYPGSGGPYTLVNDRRRTGVYSIRYVGGVLLSLNETGIPNRLVALGLTPPDFIPTIYNLLPYSWLVDYFLNLGDLIEAFCAPRIILAWGCKTDRDINITKYDGCRLIQNYDFTNKQSIKQYRATGGSAVFTVTKINRSVLQGNDLMPTLELKLPNRIKPYLNITALLATSQRSLFK